MAFSTACYDWLSLRCGRKPVSITTSESLLTDDQNLQQDLQVYVSVDEPISNGIDEEWLESVAKLALAVALDSRDASQMSLLITDDQTVQGLNAKFRGLDEVTDVLSFSAEHQGHWEGADDGPDDLSSDRPDRTSNTNEVQFILPPGEPTPLGEVIVSCPQAKRQAEEHGVTLEHELAHLIIHGVLHLTGHDHVEPEESTLMQSKELAVLESLRTAERL
jgi:probable rRNA maturation factor